MREPEPDQTDRIIEQHLEYLRGQRPRPDLGALNEPERTEARQLLLIVDALAGSLPAAPPLSEDPVAARLGLVDAASA